MRNQYEKQEKVLWYAQIMIFLGALATWFNHMDMHTFYTINIILSVISIISLTLDLRSSSGYIQILHLIMLS